MLQSFVNAAVFAGRAYRAWQAGEGIIEFVIDLFEDSDELSAPDEPANVDL
ncbi:MAG: hypothetical protein ACRDTT_22435 [Pseudonocardiaceae bacterium]